MLHIYTNRQRFVYVSFLLSVNNSVNVNSNVYGVLQRRNLSPDSFKIMPLTANNLIHLFYFKPEIIYSYNWPDIEWQNKQAISGTVTTVGLTRDRLEWHLKAADCLIQVELQLNYYACKWNYACYIKMHLKTCHLNTKPKMDAKTVYSYFLLRFNDKTDYFKCSCPEVAAKTSTC